MPSDQQVTYTAHLRDRNNKLYLVDIVTQDNDGFDANILWERIHVGQIKWVINETKVLELADLVILENPVSFQRGCVSFNRFFNRTPKSFRHTGLGTAMLEYVIAQAQKLGMSAIYGEITENDAAKTPYLIEWYQRHGFSIGDCPCRLPGAIATIYRKL